MFSTPDSRKMVVRKQPHYSIEQTVEYMRDLAEEGQTSPLVRHFALEAISKIKPKDATSEIGALYHACCRDIHYVSDPIGAEFLQHPEVTIKTAAGDCDDMTILLATTLCMSEVLSIGHPCRFRIVGFDGDDYSHVFLETLINGRYVALDPVAGPQTAAMLKRVTKSKVFDITL